MISNTHVGKNSSEYTSHHEISCYSFLVFGILCGLYNVWILLKLHYRHVCLKCRHSYDLKNVIGVFK